MSIRLGGDGIFKVYRGDVELAKIYAGAALVYEKDGAPPDVDAVLLENGTDALLLETGAPVERDITIPSRSDAATLDGSEWWVIVQGDATKKARASLIAGYLDV